MPSTCDTKRKIADDIEQENIVRDDAVEEFDEKVYITPTKMEKLNAYLEKKFGSDYIKSEEFDKSVKEVYGKKDKRMMLAVKIKAIADGNRIYWDYIQEYIYLNLPENFKPHFVNGQIPLDEMTESMLKNIYKDIAAWSHAGNGDWWGTGVVGKFMVQVGLPSTLARKEATGSYYVFQKTSKLYASKLSNRINDFMMKPSTRKSKLDYGWSDLTKEIHSLISYIPIKIRKKLGHSKTERMLMRFFILETYGDANDNTIIRYNEKLGDYEIAQNYMPLIDPVTKEKQYYDKGKEQTIFAFKGYVPLKDFEGGKWYLPIAKIRRSKDLIKALDKIRERFRKLDSELFEYQNKEFKQSVDNILKAYEKVFDLNVDELNYALTGFFPNEVTYGERSAYSARVKKKLEGKEELFEKLKETITGTAVLNPYWGEQGDQQKKNHFPAVYNQYRLPFLYEHIVAGYLKQLEELEIEYKEAVLDGNITLGKILRKERKVLVRKLARAEKLIDDMSEVTMDMNSEGIEIPVIQNQKRMKSMSNSINPLNMRADSHAYYSSLRTTMSAIERNNLIAVMIEQIGRAKSDAVIDMIINNFKVPFAFTDTKSGIGPLDFSTENIVSKFGKDSEGNFKVKPQVAAEWMRIIGAGISAQMLQGFGTAIQNITAIQQAAFDYGAGRMKDALFEYGSDRGTQWREFIQRSGVLEFRDFFSKSLTNDIISNEIELDVHNRIIGAILKYYGYKKKYKVFGKYVKSKGSNDSRPAAQAENDLRNEIEQILLSSEAYVRISETYLPTEERALGRSKIYKRKKLKGHIQKYVNWAITKEYEFSPLVKEWSVKNFLPKIIGSTAGQAFKFVTNQIAASTKVPLTMSKGEELIRTVAFIIGVTRAQELGIVEDVDVGELKGKDFETAIEIGRMYSHNSNFGLTPQDVGTLWWSEGGNLFGKFKIWSVQKFSKDVTSFKKAYTSLMDVEDLITSVEDPQNRKKLREWFKVMKNFGKQVKKGPKALRSSNPEFAQFRDMFVWQSCWTILFDLFLFGPLSLPAIRFVGNRFGLRSVGGMRSDLLGLMYFFPVVILRVLLSDEEDDEARWAFQHLLRHSFVGYLPSKGLDIVWSWINVAINNDEGPVTEAIHKTLDPITPGRGFIPGKDLIKWGVDGKAPY